MEKLEDRNSQEFKAKEQASNLISEIENKYSKNFLLIFHYCFKHSILFLFFTTIFIDFPINNFHLLHIIHNFKKGIFQFL